MVPIKKQSRTAILGEARTRRKHRVIENETDGEFFNGSLERGLPQGRRVDNVTVAIST